MKNRRLLSLVLVLCLTCSFSFAKGTSEGNTVQRKAFSALGIGVEVGTPGVGISLATPLSNHFYLRGGYSFVPGIAIKTKETATTTISPYGSFSVPYETKFDYSLHNGHILVDWVPSSKSKFPFFLTGGLYFGNNNIIALNLNCNMTGLINAGVPTSEITGATYSMEKYYNIKINSVDSQGHANVDATAKINAVRPYLGFGFGQLIPKAHRVGFRVELGAWYHGTPKIESPNLIEQPGSDLKSKLNQLGFYPKLSFQLTVRLAGE